MPYINKEEREMILLDQHTNTPGQLNFLITSVINNYLNTKELRYQTINDILGALEGAKLEFVRRVVNPYEDKKILENGDVYDS